MPDLLKRFGALILIAFLVLLTIVSMVRDRDTLARGGRPLPWWQAVVLELTALTERVVAAPFEGLERLGTEYVDLIGVRAENQRLRRRMAEIESENLQLREALVASGHLARIAGMRDEIDIPMLPSEVVGLDVSPWFRSVLIDRGESHGVRPGHPVMTHEGVVGLVTATAGRAAKTMLLLDRQSSVDAVVQRSRARGVLRGVGREHLEFEFVVRDADVALGDVIVTSGLGGVYPKGLRLGQVVQLEASGGRLMRTAIVDPAVDLGQLEQVFVMLRRGPTMELLYRPNRPEEDLPGPAWPEGAEAGAAAGSEAHAEAEAAPAAEVSP